MNRLSLRFAVLACAALIVPVSTFAADDDYDILREKWAGVMTGGTLNGTDSVLLKKINGDPLIAGEEGIADNARKWANSMQTASGRTCLWLDLPDVIWTAATQTSTLNTEHIASTYERLALMARALRTDHSDVEFAGSGSTEAQAIRDKIKDGVEWMYDNSFKNNQAYADMGFDYPKQDWFHVEIAIPSGLGQTLVLLSTGPFAFTQPSNGGFTQNEINAYTRPMFIKQRKPETLAGASGQNGAWKVRTWMYLGILRKNMAPDPIVDNGSGSIFRDFLAEGRARIDGYLVLNNTHNKGWDSEGFRADGSFYGHINHSYTGGYGQGYYGVMLELLEVCSGITNQLWAVNMNAATHTMTDWLVGGSDLAMFRSQYFQSVRGRYLTRTGEEDGDAFNGLATIYSAMGIAEMAAPADQARLRSLIEAWLVETPDINNPRGKFTNRAGISIPNYLRSQRYFALTAVPAARPVLDTYKQFTETATTAVHRPTWAAGVSMFTKNLVVDNVNPAWPAMRPLITSNEAGSSDTPLGAYLGNGGLQILNGDVTEYDASYYDNLDWKRIPGTTINGSRSPVARENRYLNNSNFAGGVQLGRYGVTGFQLEPANVTPTASRPGLGKFHARKGWFFFDREVVALGSDIRRTDTAVTDKVHTNIQNWRIRDDNSNVFKLGTSTSGGMSAYSTGFPVGVRKAWLEGNLPGTHLGYYFPVATNLSVERPFLQGRPDRAGAYFHTFFINHGVPSSGGYQYVVLPNFTEAQVDTYAANPEINVLENSVDAQAVSKPSLYLTGALFFKNQSKTVQSGGANFLGSNKPSAVIVEDAPGAITIAASDPTWEGTTPMTVELHRKASGWETKSDGITVIRTTPTIQMTVDTIGARGKTFALTIHKRFEPERDLSFLVAHSGDAVVPYANEAGASNGGIVSYNANAVGDYVRFRLLNQMPGTYRVFVRYKTGNNRGQVGLRIGTDQTTMTPQDDQNYETFSSGTGYADADLGLVTFLTAGDRFFEFKANGKHASSSSYRIVIDSIELVPQ